jgi:acetyl-CoA carboxylase biotin carboxyl carrier protein
VSLSDDDVREILRIIDETPLDELRLETGDFMLHVRRGVGAGELTVPPPTPRRDRPRPAVPPAQLPEVQTASADGLVTIESPMLGTFYRAEGPGKEPFVEVGSRVEPDTTVCIIEVMKMMNSVPAGVAGVVTEVVADNGELVEFGAPLFRVQPQ